MLGVPGVFDHVASNMEQPVLSSENREWLMKMGLWDYNKDDTAMKIRYERFKGIKFGVVPLE
jgi:hypothetical protein